MPSLPRIVYSKPSSEPWTRGYGPRCRLCGEDEMTRMNPDELCPRCLTERYGIVVPDGVACRIKPLDGADPDWSRYWMEYVGFEIPAIPDDDRPIIGYEDHILELRLLRAWCDGCCVGVVQQWDPTTGYRMSYAPKDPRHIMTSRDLSEIKKLRRFMMHHVETRGRPRLEEEQPPTWRQIATDAIEKKRENPKRTWAIIADTHFNVDERTLREYRRRLRE